ncbi:MAG TPA: hypothetical protein VK210_07765, partial [Terriglobia bacterium]|nr:hypothetical protein [Terriglobia bacterium]
TPNIRWPGETRGGVGASDVRPSACSPKVSLIRRHYRGSALEAGGEQALSPRGRRRRLGHKRQSRAQDKRNRGGAYPNSGSPATRGDRGNPQFAPDTTAPLRILGKQLEFHRIARERQGALDDIVYRED